jgi:hypothetical protein
MADAFSQHGNDHGKRVGLKAPKKWEVKIQVCVQGNTVLEYTSLAAQPPFAIARFCHDQPSDPMIRYPIPTLLASFAMAAKFITVHYQSTASIDLGSIHNSSISRLKKFDRHWQEDALLRSHLPTSDAT